MKVASMLAPRNEVGMDTAHAMRALMRADLDEYDMADRAREMQIDPNDLNAAWTVLNSNERSAWKALLKLERPNGY